VQHNKKKFNFFISVSFRSSDNFKVRKSSVIAFVFIITLDRSLIIDVSCTNSLLIGMCSNSANSFSVSLIVSATVSEFSSAAVLNPRDSVPVSLNP